jgi:hypothetical protein
MYEFQTNGLITASSKEGLKKVSIDEVPEEVYNDINKRLSKTIPNNNLKVGDVVGTTQRKRGAPDDVVISRISTDATTNDTEVFFAQ